MAWAMVATAFAQTVLGAIGYPADPRGGVFSVLFALPWLLSARLFRKAALA
jgi:hypothetical protein